MDELATQSLDLVSRELTQTLETARGEIEDYVDGQSDSESLVRAASLLHLAAGALKIVEIHGAALLTEEMEQTCHTIHASGDRQASLPAIEALTRAMVQLPAYLERLINGGSDVALVLLPLLNDLRTARNQPPLSEGTILLLKSGPFERLRESQAEISEQTFGDALPKLARRLRPKFQSALLAWIRGAGGEAALTELIEVCDALENQAESEPVRQLWAVTAGVLVALRHGDFEASVAIKRLLGQVDRQLKQLVDAGEQAFVTAPPVELMNSLIYYVAKARTEDPRITALRETFGVDTSIPGAAELEKARENLAGPSVNLMRTVAEAIREDLGEVKDVLDIFVRTGMDKVADLAPQIDLLKKIGDTLGVLGLEAARGKIQSDTDDLATIVAAGAVEDAAVLERVAASLLDVEDMLERELVRSGQVDGADDGKPLQTKEYQHVMAAVMRECIVNLAKIKEVVTRVLDDPSSLKVLDQVEPQMRGIVAGLLMLNKNRAVNVIERIGRTITTRLASGSETLKPALIDRLADAIVSIEYYMETIALGRSDPFYMLDNANRCLDTVEASAPRQPEAVPPPDIEPAPVAAKPVPRELPVMSDRKVMAEPELVEVFIEEAKEEIEKICEALPRWVEQQADHEALIAVRRSYHTLKGSGRMIGAELLGEFAWSIENLLNRVINQTLETTPAIVDFVSEATAVLPRLIEQLELGISPNINVGDMIARAEALAEGRSGAYVAPAAEDAGDIEPLDPVLRQIFVKELREHLAAIRDWVGDHSGRSPPIEITEPLHRACHTLFGSARMANCEPAKALTESINRKVREGFEADRGFGAEAVATLGRCADEVERLCVALEAGEPFTIDSDLLEAVDGLELVDLVTDTDSFPAIEETAEPAAEEAVADADESSEPAVADYDPEIAGIFCEEAAELLEQAEGELQALRQQPGSEAAVSGLKRVLHTLKGGARLAGIVAMGNLSHALETMLPRLGGGSDADAGLRLVQKSFDRLSQMRDAVDAGQTVAEEAALLAELEHYGEAGGADYEETMIQPSITAEIPALTDFEAEPEPPADDMTLIQPVDFSGILQQPPAPEMPEPAAPAVEEERPAAAAAPRAERAETARVDAALLDELLNGAGEISIFQSRLGQQIRSIEFHLGELRQTVTRLREQLRGLEAETEAQILHRHQGDSSGDEQFDPLELDRYSTIQQLSRALAETSNDVGSINDLLHGLTSEADTLLTQQSRVTTELSDGLMQTRMVPFNRQVSRLSRIVRQAADESGKQAELATHGAESQLDRQILEAILPALEHLLRNAVVHGIETPAARASAGKPEAGTVTLDVRREGSEVLIGVADDGAGLDLNSIRRKATEKGLLKDGESMADEDVVELILLPGFSTADELTQSAGRGVGMDVVDTEVKRLGGSLRIETEKGKGTHFRIRLPYTLAITHALVVNVGDETFALPLPTIEGIARVRREELLEILTQDDPRMTHGDGSYRVQHLGSLVGGAPSALPEEEGAVSLVLVRAGENSAALLTDSLEGSREIIVKTLGPHVESVDGVTGATILADGRVVVILDAGTLLRAQAGDSVPSAPAPVVEQRALTGLVVDDSITMRRVTQRLLERRGVRVHTARDGLDAIEVLGDHEVDFIVLDIEMPRMDGYQFASHVRNDPRIKDTPIIMVTSRSGEKHRARAIELGVNDYLGKPYQEADLVKAIEALVGRSL